MDTQRPVDFANSEERSKWIIENADYYSTFVMVAGKKYGDDYKTLAKAEKVAKAAAKHLGKPVMIYAVKRNENTWVKTIAL